MVVVAHCCTRQWFRHESVDGRTDATKHIITPGADPGFFVGGGRTQKMGGNLVPWPPHGPQFSPSAGHIGTLGPIFVFMGPILGQNWHFT